MNNVFILRGTDREGFKEEMKFEQLDVSLVFPLPFSLLLF